MSIYAFSLFRPEYRWVLVGGIALAWMLLLAIVFNDIVTNYFPFAEEWPLLAMSLPEHAHFSDWWTKGFALSPPPYEALRIPAINFIRPFYNFGHWLSGAIWGDYYGRFLYLNYLAIGTCAGAAYLCMSSFGGSRATHPLVALAMALALPLMPSLLSEAGLFQPVLIPMMGYDAVIAMLCLLAYASYQRQHYGLAALLLFIALFTKEQSLPVIVALPLSFAWSRRRNWRQVWPTLLLLSAPLIFWICLRLVVFGNVSSGTYVMNRSLDVIARSFFVNLLRLPLHAPAPGQLLRDPASVSALMVVCNLALLASVVVMLARRFWRQDPDAAEVSLVLSYGFLALVGTVPRFGAVLHAFLFVVLARASDDRMERAARALALASLAVFIGLQTSSSIAFYPIHAEQAQWVYKVGRRYDAVLKEAGASSVVVLNDPNTVYTTPMTMVKVLDSPVKFLVKASDYPWGAPKARAPEPACEVAIRAQEHRRLELWQSCGFRLMGAPVPPTEGPLTLALAPGIKVTFPEHASGVVFPNVGQRLVLEWEQDDLKLLYFDPQQDQFFWVPQS